MATCNSSNSVSRATFLTIHRLPLFRFRVSVFTPFTFTGHTPHINCCRKGYQSNHRYSISTTSVNSSAIGRVRVSRSPCRILDAEAWILLCQSNRGDFTDSSDSTKLLSESKSKSPSLPSSSLSNSKEEFEGSRGLSFLCVWWEWAVLVSPFFFWGTAMVAMKQVLPKAGPFFVGAFRLIPAGFLLIAYAAFQRRSLPSGFTAWFSITLFAIVDATCFQGFLAEGLQKTSAGLGSVIIDSQPLTVAVLAALLFGESIDLIGATGLLLGVAGLLVLEAPTLALDENNISFWSSGEFWMLLAAQSMALGTVMVRWVSKYTDPVMATGWHMVIGGLPLVAISFVNNDPALGGRIMDLTLADFSALLYTSILGSAVSYGVFFYNATKGSLTKLSSLTFLTPVFASVFGFIYLGESYAPIQLGGAFLILVAIVMVNYDKTSSRT